MRTGAELTAEEKHHALEALLNSETLARSGRLKNLLRFIGQAEIEGRSAELNEYTIGVEALARPEGYSTLEDSSVRSRIHELRQRLERYYSTEAPDTSVRIELPKGSHCPRFVRSGVPPAVYAVRVTPRRNLAWAAAAGLAAGVMATSLVVLLWSYRPSPANAVGWTPALTAVWQPFVAGNIPILISFESRLFLAAGNSGLVRDFEVNEMGNVDSSGMLMKFQKMLDLPQFSENRNYAEFGFVPAATVLTRLLSAKKTNITARRSGDVSWNDIRNNNLILLGKPATDPQIRHFLPQTEFVDDKTRIRVLHPKTGERAEYVESFDPRAPANWSEKYAVISVGPGPERGRSVMCLAASGAEHPWALAHYVTDPVHAEDLVRRLRLPSGLLPAAYQVVIRARFKAQEPTQIEYVTHRVLAAAAKK
jgi:hypothetical protein